MDAAQSEETKQNPNSDQSFLQAAVIFDRGLKRQ